MFFVVIKIAMLLVRVTHFWRICGVLHSDVKYMDDELRVKPTPDQNPLLGRKINTLYKLLTSREIQKSRLTVRSVVQKAISESETNNEKVEPDSPSNGSNVELQNTTDNSVEANKTPEKSEQPTKPYFENASMRLSLPIPVDSSQRLLMINVGDDFTHLWFPTWHKFLSAKRIQQSFLLSKKLDKAIEMSQHDNHPKVFVSNSHDNCIFIGPYGNTDRQNLALFVRHENHMELSELYYKRIGESYTRKTKGNQNQN